MGDVPHIADSNSLAPLDVESERRRFKKSSYLPPEVGFLYCVRDKAHGERIIRVTAMSSDGAIVDVETVETGKPSKAAQLSVDSLERQAEKGWCSLLVPVDEVQLATVDAAAAAGATMRLDVQHFSRCAADIVRAGIKFDTQLIKDVADGPFRAGNYHQAFITFEQYALSFTTAVGASRREIAAGRRALVAQKAKLSGKEIQERTAAFVRSEQLVNTAERSFSAILEGLRMYLRALQG
jgi:hypothetical protein